MVVVALSKGLSGITKLRIVKRSPLKDINAKDVNVVLTEEQQNAVNQILTHQNNVHLLYGVTGSGKTEIYMRVINEMLSKNKSAIMLVPEISLTPKTVKQFRARFGDCVAVLHSGLSAGEKFDEWGIKHLIDCNITRLQLSPPSLRDWIGPEKIDLLKNLKDLKAN